MAPNATAEPITRPVPVSISPRPIADDEALIISDLDTLVETVMCSCNAGDDQPY